MHTEFTIKKISKGKSFRTLYIPDTGYKKYLKNKLPQLLESYYSLEGDNRYCHSFLPGRNCVSNALYHVGFSYNISLDIKDFFDAITPEHVASKLSRDLIEDCFIEGAPRQGLPTSPIIANIAMIDIDNEIAASISKLTSEFVYTRYADDICVSFNQKQYLHQAKYLIINLLNRHGFRVNNKKTTFQSLKNGKLVITGVAVDKTGVHPTRKTRRKMRAAKHQGNDLSYRGLHEWAECKLPGQVTSRSQELQQRSQKPITCEYCGEQELIWFQIGKSKLRLYSKKTKMIHDCGQHKRQHVFEHLKTLGFTQFETLRKPWSTGFYILQQESLLLLFRKRGIDIYHIDFLGYFQDYTSPPKDIEDLNSILVDHEMCNTRAEDSVTQGVYLDGHKREELLRDNQMDEFQRGFTQSEFCSDIFKPASKYLSLIERINYKTCPLKVHKFIMSLTTPVNFRDELYSANSEAASQLVSSQPLNDDYLDYIDWDIPF